MSKKKNSRESPHNLMSLSLDLCSLHLVHSSLPGTFMRAHEKAFDAISGRKIALWLACFHIQTQGPDTRTFTGDVKAYKQYVHARNSEGPHPSFGRRGDSSLSHLLCSPYTRRLALLALLHCSGTRRCRTTRARVYAYVSQRRTHAHSSYAKNLLPDGVGLRTSIHYEEKLNEAGVGEEALGGKFSFDVVPNALVFYFLLVSGAFAGLLCTS